jgi:hypothetical protein
MVEAEMRFYWLTLGVLAVWRITHLLHAEDGPGNVFGRLRRLAGEGFWGAILDCFHCLSVWVAVLFACWQGNSWKERLLLWPALSGGAILAERLAAKPGDGEPPAAVFLEEPGDPNDLLRRQ